MKKRSIVAVVMVLIMIMTLTACGKKTTPEEKADLCVEIKAALSTTCGDSDIVNDPEFKIFHGFDYEFSEFWGYKGAKATQYFCELMGVSSLDEVYKAMGTKGELRVTDKNGNITGPYIVYVLEDGERVASSLE